MPRRPTVVLLAAVLAACAGVREDVPAPPAEGVSLGVPAGQPPPAARATAPRIAIAGHPVLGAADAPVTIVEFMDYECPYCQGYARDTFPGLRRQYIDTGQVRYVTWDFPLSRHPRSRPAAIAAACAGEQGRFREMHEALLADGQLREEDFAGHARWLGLDLARFDACRGEPRHHARLDRDLAEARAIGVGGTPTLLVGASAGAVAQGRLTSATRDPAALEQLIERYLAR